MRLFIVIKVIMVQSHQAFSIHIIIMYVASFAFLWDSDYMVIPIGYCSIPIRLQGRQFHHTPARA